MHFTSPLFHLGASLLATSSIVSANFHPRMIPQQFNPKNEKITQSFSTGSDIQQGVFQQLIDHEHPEKGTFSQRYLYNIDHYNGPGSPVILTSTGEVPAETMRHILHNTTIAGQIMITNGAAGILLEHRYYGQSSPHENLTVETLQDLTIKNAIYDHVYFAQNVRFPFDPEGLSAPDKAPWVFTGCSYAGALAAWTNALAPGTFWAYQGSSATVQAIYDFWEYNDVQERAMPRNCSSDVKKVVRHIDNVLDEHDEEATLALKKKFNLEELEHDSDFAAAVGAFPEWQNINFSEGYGPFHQFCDYIENQWPGSSLPTPGEEGVGESKALEGYAKWSREVFRDSACDWYGYFPKNSVQCFNTHNASSPIYADTSSDNPGNRQYYWLTCNEPMGFWPGCHKGHDGVVSQYVTAEHGSDQCALWFPSGGSNYTYGLNKGWTAERLNAYTGGWNVGETTRFFWVNGETDPWRPTTISADHRPGGPMQGSEKMPIRIIPDGRHCSDFLTSDALVNEGVGAVFNEELQTIEKWVGEFYEEKHIKRP